MLLLLVAISLISTAQACVHGEVRLDDVTGGSKGGQGVVQLCHEQTWRPVCESNLTPHEASIICQQQGYPICGDETKMKSILSVLHGIDLSCIRGNETTVQECSHSLLQFNCSTVWVTCSKINCINDSLRLVGGASYREGRVEVCVDNCWGTVCGEGWTNEDAGNVCSKLGYPSTNATVHNFGPGQGPVCNYSRDASGPTCNNTSTCNHAQDVGVHCMSHEQVLQNTTCERADTNSNSTCEEVITAMNNSNTTCKVAAMNTSRAYEVLTGLLAAVLVGVVSGWIASCLYIKARHSKRFPAYRSYAINNVAIQRCPLDSNESTQSNQYITCDPNYELVTSKTNNDYDTLHRKSSTQPTKSPDVSHDNEYSAIDKTTEVHYYRTLEMSQPTNGMADETKVGGASPPSLPKEYEIPTPTTDKTCQLTD